MKSQKNYISVYYIFVCENTICSKFVAVLHSKILQPGVFSCLWMSITEDFVMLTHGVSDCYCNGFYDPLD